MLYLGKTVPGPGSSGPGTNTKRLLQNHVSEESVKSTTLRVLSSASESGIRTKKKLSSNPFKSIQMSYLLWMLGYSQIRSASALKDSANNIVASKKISFALKHDRAKARALKRRQTFERSELVSAVRSRREISTEYEAGGRHGRIAWNHPSFQSITHIHTTFWRHDGFDYSRKSPHCFTYNDHKRCSKMKGVLFCSAINKKAGLSSRYYEEKLLLKYW